MMAIITKQTRKIIESHFYNYKKDKEQAVEMILESTPIRGETPISRNGYSDPTGNKACKLVMIQQWCEVVEKTIQFFQAQDDLYFFRKHMGIAALIRMRYFERRSPEYIMRNQNIEKTTYYSRVNDVLIKATLYAKDYRLIPNEE
jgi:hypothetical protein